MSDWFGETIEAAAGNTLNIVWKLFLVFAVIELIKLVAKLVYRKYFRKIG